MGWYISKQKLKFEGIEQFQEMEIDKWHNLVENDSELFWFENTKHGREYFSSPIIEEKDKIYKVSAHFDISKKYGHGLVQLKFNNKKSHIWIMHTKETLPRIEKYYEIAKKLDANLYKDRAIIDEKKMEQIREKYKSKGGKQAPKEE